MYQDWPKSINLKAEDLPSQNDRMLKKKANHDFNTTKILFMLIAVILSSMVFFMIIYLIPYFYHGWTMLSNYFSQYKAWSFFPGL